MDLVNWYGISGQKYTFEVYPLGTEFFSLSGVYILCTVLPDGRYKALYVGETQSFHDRLNAGLYDHDGYVSATRYGVSHIGALLVDDSTLRLRIETDLRHALHPVCNRQNTPAST